MKCKTFSPLSDLDQVSAVLLDRVREAAEQLPVDQRGMFLRSVASRVAGLSDIGMAVSKAEIESAIAFALNEYDEAHDETGGQAFNGKLN